MLRGLFSAGFALEHLRRNLRLCRNLRRCLHISLGVLRRGLSRNRLGLSILHLRGVGMSALLIGDDLAASFQSIPKTPTPHCPPHAGYTGMIRVYPPVRDLKRGAILVNNCETSAWSQRIAKARRRAARVSFLPSVINFSIIFLASLAFGACGADAFLQEYGLGHIAQGCFS